MNILRTLLVTLFSFVPLACADSAGTTIADIQGSGATSPLKGQTATVSGIVTGDFQDNDADTTRNLGGFYIQQENPDTDPRTSDGLFVFDAESPGTDIDVGDRVEVTGTVKEHFGETQLKATTVRVVGSGSIQATDVSLPLSDLVTNHDGDYIPDMERYEGMLVRFPQKLRVSNLRFLERFGEVGIAAGDRPTQLLTPMRRVPLRTMRTKSRLLRDHSSLMTVCTHQTHQPLNT